MLSPTARSRSSRNVIVVGVAAVVLVGVVAVVIAVISQRPWSDPNAPAVAPSNVPGASLPDSASNEPRPVPPTPPTPTEHVPTPAEDGQARVDEAARQAREGMPAPGGLMHPGSQVFDAMLTVTDVTGLRGVAPGTTCQLAFRYGETVNDLHCRAVISCGMVGLYGDVDGRGFFACTAFSSSHRLVVGADPSSTATDGDPMLTVDTARGTLTMSDDSRGARGRFSLSGTVTVPPPHAHGTGYGS